MKLSDTERTEVTKDIDKYIAGLLGELGVIYKNKSSDEYKMAGDITRANFYEDMEKMIANLSILKGFSKAESSDLHAAFNVLHRPIFKKSVTNYIHEPNETNTIFTVVFTAGYRILVGELSRIYSSTEATENGIVYKPTKFFTNIREQKFIRSFKNDMERRIDTFIRQRMDHPVQESWASIGTGIVSALNFIKNHELNEWGSLVATLLNGLFGHATELNPISFIDDVLTVSYDQKVKEFDNVCDEYNATKEAYEEYMKIPESQRNKKIESKYIKNLEKYNIRMKNLQAKIKHYDQRAQEESKETISKIKLDDIKDTTKSDTKKDTNTSSTTEATDDDFDF